MYDRHKLKLYIRQGLATKKLLQKTNQHGAYCERIREIERKIKCARELLKHLG